MTFKEKIQSDLEAYKRVLEKLKEYDCEDKAIAIVSGMIDGCENVLEGLKNVKYFCCLLDFNCWFAVCRSFGIRL